jgi:hypothetical protein
MNPREDDLNRYRINIQKSWKVMYEVVRNVSEECYVQHTSPIEGLSYDCLSLLTKNRDQGLSLRIHLNRNGKTAQAGDLVRDIWKKSESPQGIIALADDLIASSHLTKVENGGSDSMVTLVAKTVCDWIDENEGRNMCISPIRWPEGCKKLNPDLPELFAVNTPGKIWPEWLRQRFIILGIDYEEMLRIDLADGEILVNQHFQKN